MTAAEDEGSTIEEIERAVGIEKDFHELNPGDHSPCWHLVESSHFNKTLMICCECAGVDKQLTVRWIER